MAESLYTSENPVFAAFCFYGAILCLKMIAIAVLTGRMRFRKMAFANPEDTVVKAGVKVRTDEDVERIRRAHLNDLENILPFLLLAFLYVSIDPIPSSALIAFRMFTGARVIHSIVYAVFVLPQPARALSYIAGQAVNIYLAVSIILAYI
nr:mGST1-like protein [Diaphanosoma celebensis]